MEKSKKTTVSLILGSGGARGLAHIGVIKWLEENNYEIKSIAGCSIGSLIGGVYAAGKLNQLTQWMLALNKTDIASLLDFSWGNTGGLFKGDKIIETLVGFLEDIQIENLSIPFTAVATDIITEKEVWINSGSLFEAIRASISLPMFFTPVAYGDAVLIDGGVLNPVPIAPTFKDDTDLTIAVNLGAAPVKKTPLETPAFDPVSNLDIFQDQIKNFLQKNNLTSTDTPSKKLSMYEVADRAFDTMQSTIARQKIAAYPPDIEIEIPRNTCGTLEFDKAAEMIAYGYQKAIKTYNNLNEETT